MRNVESAEIIPLDKKECTTKTVELIATGEGIAWIELKIKSKDNNVIEYYQLERTANVYLTLGKEKWMDYFHISSIQEIHQRFTNYLLLVLTIVMILFMGIPLLISLLDC